MSSLKKLNVLIVDARADRRGRLKQMLQQIYIYRDPETAQNPQGAIEIIESASDPISVVMFSAEYSMDDLRLLVDGIASLESNDPIVLFGILGGTDSERSEDELVMLGIHGYIREPFSVDELQERGEKAREQLGVMKEERCRTAIQEIIDQMCQEIDDMSVFLKAGLDPSKCYKDLRDLRKRLDAYQPEYDDMIEEFLLRTLGEATIPDSSYLPGGITCRERRKLLKAKRTRERTRGFSIQRDAASDKTIVRGVGKLSSVHLSRDLESVLDRLLEEECSNAVLDLSQASETNPRVIATALQYKKAFKESNGNFLIRGDKGFVKRFLGVLKKLKLGALNP